jgi:hypothetical protein
MMYLYGRALGRPSWRPYSLLVSCSCSKAVFGITSCTWCSSIGDLAPNSRGRADGNRKKAQFPRAHLLSVRRQEARAFMNGRAPTEALLAALRDSLATGKLERVKRAADALHQAGGDPVAALSSIAVNELPDGDRRILALRALEELDFTAARSLAGRLRVPLGRTEAHGIRAVVPQARAKSPQGKPSQWWIAGFLIALAILWPTYSVYRFNHPRPSPPPEPMPPWDDQEVRIEATTVCQLAIKQQLRDPDSADFPFLSPSDVEIPYDANIKVRGFLHASNGLGLKVRADYVCAIKVDRNARKAFMLDAQLVQR